MPRRLKRYIAPRSRAGEARLWEAATQALSQPRAEEQAQATIQSALAGLLEVAEGALAVLAVSSYELTLD